MKALILAAGYGKRLRPITEKIPKAMVEVCGTPLLVRTLNILTLLDIKEIGIVVGHMADYIQKQIGYEWNGAKISYYENRRYGETNNIASFYAAAEFCDDDMLLLECDICFSKELIEFLMKGNGACSILVSPFNKITMSGSAIRAQGEMVVELILGTMQDCNFNYTTAFKTVNCYRFTRDFVQKYLKLIRWYIETIGEQCYYEKVLGSLIYLQDFDIRIINVPEEMWCEIDNVEDLHRAERKFTIITGNEKR